MRPQDTAAAGGKVPATEAVTIASLMEQASELTDEIADHESAIASIQVTKAGKMKKLRAIKNQIVTLQLKEGK